MSANSANKLLRVELGGLNLICFLNDMIYFVRKCNYELSLYVRFYEAILQILLLKDLREHVWG